jgi:hypothetical protein
MGKLEHYLDQVCRSIGGPKALRQHVRQELREHLLDAAAEHRSAGLSQEEALDRALADFGGPEQMRSELEATHGHRLLPVVIDKAMQWKERTMQTKWLWTTWTYLALAGVSALEVLWIAFASMFLVPKFQKLMAEGMLDPAIFDEQGVAWMPSFVVGVRDVGDYTTWIALGALVAWAAFEWCVYSDNKTFMRLSALGTAAVGLMVVAVLMAGSLSIPFMLAMPALQRIARPFAVEQTDGIDASLTVLEQALAKKDWQTMPEQMDRAVRATRSLRAALPALRQARGSPTVAELRAQLQTVNDIIQEASQAVQEKDAQRLEAALKKFHESYAPLREAAKSLVTNQR